MSEPEAKAPACDRCGGKGHVDYTAFTVWVMPSEDRIRRDRMGMAEAIAAGARLAYADIGPMTARGDGRYAYSEPCGCPATKATPGVDPLVLVRRARVLAERIKEWETTHGGGQERTER